MKKGIAVMILFSFLAAGCAADTVSSESISESSDNATPSLSPSQTINENQEDSGYEQESEVSSPAQTEKLSPQIDMYGFLGERSDGDSQITIILQGYGRYDLSYEKTKEFFEGIDFSQLEPIDKKQAIEVIEPIYKKYITENYWLDEKDTEEMLDLKTYYLNLGGRIEFITDGFTYDLDLYLTPGIAVLSVGEWVNDEPFHELEETRYYYSINQEFYDTVFERVEEYSQYGVYSSFSSTNAVPGSYHPETC